MGKHANSKSTPRDDSARARARSTSIRGTTLAPPHDRSAIERSLASEGQIKVANHFLGRKRPASGIPEDVWNKLIMHCRDVVRVLTTFDPEDEGNIGAAMDKMRKYVDCTMSDDGKTINYVETDGMFFPFSWTAWTVRMVHGINKENSIAEMYDLVGYGLDAAFARSCDSAAE